MTESKRNLHLFVIAGEASGDLLGARLMRELKAQAGTDTVLTFSGIGGPQMEAEGLDSLIPMQELALMGFFEILPHIPRLLGHIRRTAQNISAEAPDAVITIDSPGFAFRVVKACRKAWPKGGHRSPRFIHYVAPSVWAYKPGRAAKLAALFDQVLTLLPFEPPFFEAQGMRADFVGHPVVESLAEAQAGDGASFRTHHKISGSAPVVAMLPGSRMGEIKRHLPLLRDTATLLTDSKPGVVCVMPVVPHLADFVRAETQDWPCPLVVVDAELERWNAFAAANVALAKSGTVTLELALSATPLAMFYKMHPITAWLMKQMMLTKYFSLVNILQQRMVVPELLQDGATPESLANSALALLESPNACATQQGMSLEALLMLGLGDVQNPSQKAARVVLESTAF